MSTEAGTLEESTGLREQLAAQFREAEEREQVEPPPAADDSASTKERDEKGRFKASDAAAEGGGEGGSASEPAAAMEQKPAEQGEDPPEPAASALTAPPSWSADAKAKFNELPPEVQREITRREAEVHKGFTQHDEQRTLGKTFQQVLAPHAAEFRAQGRNPVQEVTNMLAMDKFLRSAPIEQRVAVIHDIARGYGIDLANTPAPEPVDPQVAAMQQRLQHLEGLTTQQQQEAQMRQHQAVISTLQAFASDPANKHYDLVRQEMAVLLEGGIAKDLKDAYDRACYANPTVRSMLQQEAAQAAEAKRRKEATERAAKAKQTGSSVKGGPGGQMPGALSANPTDLRATISAALEEAQGRV